MTWLDPAQYRDIPGWMDSADRQFLYAAARQAAPVVAVEIGVCQGRTTWVLAMAARHNGIGVVHAVDPWPLWPWYDGPSRRAAFLAMVAAEGLGDIITVHHATSLATAAGWQGEPVDLLMVDGDHEYDSVRADLAAWWPWCRGLVYGHDREMPDVQRAARDFCREVGREYFEPAGTISLWGVR